MKKNKISNTGQITRGTPLGDWIYDLVKREDIINIVDIGTWNGLGSTKCIQDAIVDSRKEDYHKPSFNIRI